MLSISLDQLRDFQKRTAYIKPNTTLPALSYIKVQYDGNSHLFTKNNVKCVCVARLATKTAPGSENHEPLLIDDRILSAIVSSPESDTITISWDKDRIYLSDGSTPVYFEKENATNFPSTPDYLTTPILFKITKSHLDSIEIAKNFLFNSESAGNYKFIHFGGEYIFAAHTNFFYISNRFSGLANIKIDSEMADVLTSIDVESFNFGELPNHYLFQIENTIYIFTKQQSNIIDIKNAIWVKLMLPGKEFVIKKNDMVQFCSRANVVSESELSRCTIEQADGKINLSLVDKSKNRGVNRSVDLKGELEKFNLDSRLFIQPIKSIPYEELKCKINNNYLMISSPDNKEWFGFSGLV